MDFIKCLNSLKSVSQSTLKDAPHPVASPSPAKGKEEGPIYRPVSITLQVERHRLHLIANSKHSGH